MLTHSPHHCLLVFLFVVLSSTYASLSSSSASLNSPCAFSPSSSLLLFSFTFFLLRLLSLSLFLCPLLLVSVHLPLLLSSSCCSASSHTSSLLALSIFCYSRSPLASSALSAPSYSSFWSLCARWLLFFIFSNAIFILYSSCHYILTLLHISRSLLFPIAHMSLLIKLLPVFSHSICSCYIYLYFFLFSRPSSFSISLILLNI